MKRWLILLSVGCLAFAGVANASVQKGDTEISALGGWITENTKDSGDDVTVWFLTGAVGYFVTDNIQVSGAAMWASMELGGDDIDVWGLGGRAAYHFMPTNQWVPYVGAQVMWASGDEGDEDADGVLWGPVVGARYELNANNDFFVEYQYHLWSGDIGDMLDDGHALMVGLVHQFK